MPHGQQTWDLNHAWMQATWNGWKHLGRTLRFSPSQKSRLQISHSKVFDIALASYVYAHMDGVYQVVFKTNSINTNCVIRAVVGLVMIFMSVVGRGCNTPRCICTSAVPCPECAEKYAKENSYANNHRNDDGSSGVCLRGGRRQVVEGRTEVVGGWGVHKLWQS